MLIHFFVFGARILPHRVGLVPGVACILAGFFLVARARGAMHSAGTNVDPYQPALTIVRNGPYRFTRNPMYLSLCLLQGGLGFLLNDWITFLFVAPLAIILHFGVILPEERYLEGKFGEQYLELKRSVRRWF